MRHTLNLWGAGRYAAIAHNVTSLLLDLDTCGSQHVLHFGSFTCSAGTRYAASLKSDGTRGTTVLEKASCPTKLRKKPDFFEVNISGPTSKYEMVEALGLLIRKNPGKTRPDLWTFSEETTMSLEIFSAVSESLSYATPHPVEPRSALLAANDFQKAQLLLFLPAVKHLPFEIDVFTSRDEALRWAAAIAAILGLGHPPPVFRHDEGNVKRLCVPEKVPNVSTTCRDCTLPGQMVTNERIGPMLHAFPNTHVMHNKDTESNIHGDLPRHTFAMPAGQTFSFEINTVHNMGPLAQAGFPHRHDFYEVFYVTGGKGEHVVDFTSYPIKPPVLFFISPGQVQFWHADEPIEGYGILFTDDFLRLSGNGVNYLHELQLFHQLTGAPEIPLHGQATTTVAELVRLMQLEYESQHADRGSVLRSWLHIFLCTAQRLQTSAPAESDASTATTRRFKQLVSEKFATQRSVAAYAGQLGVSVGHLHEVIKSATGRTPKQIILDEVALEAKRLLTHTDLTAAEICHQVGMDDPAYFGRFFKRETGTSPGQFRKSSREKYQIF